MENIEYKVGDLINIVNGYPHHADNDLYASLHSQARFEITSLSDDGKIAEVRCTSKNRFGQGRCCVTTTIRIIG